MGYAKSGGYVYKSGESGEAKYYFVEKEVPKKNNKLPTFHQIFENMQKTGGIMSNASFYNGVIYFSSLDTQVYAVNAETGKLIWKFKTGGPITFCAPLAHNGKIYFGSNDENFYCLDLNGKLLWKKQLGDIIASTALGVADSIFISNGAGYLFCLTEEGVEKWRFKMGEGSTVAPSAVNGKLFVGSFDKHVYALDVEGKLLWKFLAGERIGPPLIVDMGARDA